MTDFVRADTLRKAREIVKAHTGLPPDAVNVGLYDRSDAMRCTLAALLAARRDGKGATTEQLPVRAIERARALLWGTSYPTEEHRQDAVALALITAQREAHERDAGICDMLADREDALAIDAGSDELTPVYRRGERIGREAAAAIRRASD